MVRLGFTVLILLAGCHREAPAPAASMAAPPTTDLCEQVFDHTMSIVEATGKLGIKERLMAIAFKGKALEVCRKEGLSQAQADCLLSPKTIEALDKLDECPALKAKPLSWLKADQDPDAHADGGAR
jgi:hypothetical protein